MIASYQFDVVTIVGEVPITNYTELLVTVGGAVTAGFGGGGGGSGYY